MKIYIIYLIIMFLLISCINNKNIQEKIIQIKSVCNINHEKKNFSIQIQSDMYDDYIHRCAYIYGVDISLIKAIIKVESNYNPVVISKSNAVGLMQLKADTAGRDVYRLKGQKGEPSILELKDAAINIDLGTAYLSILQKRLEGISNIETRRYAVIVAYVNGLGALLRIFSINRNHAIQKINKLNAKQFYQYIQYHHPSKQAQRYLSKVNAIYILQQ